MIQRIKIILIHTLQIVLIIPICFSYALANDTWVTLTWENDFLAHEDSGYTNGMGISWGHGPINDSHNKDKINWLESKIVRYLADNSKNKSVELSYNISQTMYTPENIRATELIEDDRPYVGMLLWQTNLHAVNETISDRLWFSIGAVGPISGAKQVQIFIHDLIGKKRPNGWHNQINNEPVFGFSAERLWRLHSLNVGNTIEYDLVGISAADIGTIRSEIGTGIGLRLGKALNRSFMAALIIPGRTINPLAANLRNEWHLFFNLYGRYVYNNIVFNGNIFQNSHSVTLKHEQLLGVIGASYHSNRWGMVISIQDGSRFFEERIENVFFASLSVTFRW